MRRLAAVFLTLGLQAPLLAQTALPPPTEAPAGFDTPTLVQNPASQSFSNGVAEPPGGDTFMLDQQIYETFHDVNSGLGPVYNGRACAECHQNPVSGGASQFTELRVGHNDANGNFVNPTVPLGDCDLTVTPNCPIIKGRSIVNDRAVVPEAQEHIPVTENVRALRAALNTLGDGFVEAIADSTLKTIAAQQPLQTYGRIHGEAINVPIFEAPGQTRVGRFGWKDQHGSLLSFVADAYLNEMGVTSRLRPTDTTTNGHLGKVTSDPEDKPDSLNLADIDHFAAFVRGTKVPPPDTNPTLAASVQAGAQLFTNIGCVVCHKDTLVTAPAGTQLLNPPPAGSSIGGAMFVVPDALGNKTIHPYSDFLLHDIETGDGIVQTFVTNAAGQQVPLQETANKLRTAPLWGLRMRPRYMHDLLSPTLENAIERHRGEAELESHRFRELTPAEKHDLVSFLNSL